MTQKIVVSRCYGGYGLSPIAEQLLAKAKGKQVFFYTQTKYNSRDRVEEYTRASDSSNTPGLAGIVYTLTEDLGESIPELPDRHDIWFNSDEIARDDPDLVKVVEELGNEASGTHARLEVVKIPDKVKWTIHEYDGAETVEEVHRSW